MMHFVEVKTQHEECTHDNTNLLCDFSIRIFDKDLSVLQAMIVRIVERPGFLNIGDNWMRSVVFNQNFMGNQLTMEKSSHQRGASTFDN